MFRYRFIDFSRGVAAILVAVEHWVFFVIHADWGTHSSGRTVVEAVPWLFVPLRDYGGFAVQYFWMISGFIFAYVYGKSTIGFGAYCGRRIARLYPLHLLTLIVVALLQVIFVVLVGAALFMPANDLYHFVLNLFFIPSLGLETGPSFNAPIWSVAVELPIYILFWLCVRYLPMNAFVAAAIAGLFFLSQDYITFTHVDYCGMMFFIGVAVFHASAWINPKHIVLPACVVWVVGVLMALTVPAFADILTAVLVIVFVPPLLVLSALDRMSQDRTGLLDRMASFGDLSYSIYLTHMPILMLFTCLMVLFGIDRGFLADSVLAAVVFLAVTVWVSHLSLTWFENPARRWLRRVFDPSPSVPRQHVPATGRLT